jgi:pyruvate ferredoxin oxidoreductase delta subunit
MQTPPGGLMPKPAVSEGKRYLLGPVAVRFSAANTGSWRIERPVFNAEKCAACGLCAKFCPAGIVTVEKAAEKGGKHDVRFDWEFCKGCGVCMTSCARHCIEMQPERDFV